LRLLLTHSRWHYIHRFCSISKGLPNWQGPFHPKIIFYGHQFIFSFKVWLAGPVLIVVGSVLCGKVSAERNDKAI
jgi:hypothetical protein